MAFRSKIATKKSNWIIKSMHGVRVEIPAESLSSDQVISLKVYGGEGPLLPPHQIPLSPFVTLGVAGSEPGQVIHRISFDSKRANFFDSEW